MTSKAPFDFYWIIASTGDPIPNIGSGFRHVRAQIGRKWVRVKAFGQEKATRIPLRKWEQMETTRDYGQDLGTVLAELRNPKRSPSCTLPPVT